MRFTLYPLIIGIFAATGLIWSTTQAVHGKTSPRIRAALINSSLFSGIALLFSLLVGSRLAYGFLHWGSYSNDLLKLLQLNAGGLDWLGLAMGALIAILTYAGFSSLNPAEILSSNFHLIAILAIGIWLGAQVAGIGYGRVVEPAWWAFPVIDSAGDIHPRIPLPAVGAVMSLLSYVIIDQFFQRKSLPAVKTLVFATIQFALIYLATFFRADPMVIIGSQPLDRLAALIHMALGLIAIASWTGYSYWQAKKLHNQTAD